jgi:CHAT domain-containing protein
MLSGILFRGWLATPMKRRGKLTVKGLTFPWICIFLAVLWLRPADLRKPSPLRGVGKEPSRLVWGRFIGQDPSEQNALSSTECQQALNETDDRDVHRLALLYARCGEVERSVQILQKALGTHPHSAEVWSDLAAVHLNIGDPKSLAEALHSAEKAITEDAALPEAQFNQAQALELLSLVPRARATWEDYLDVDSDSTWAVVAQQRLDALRQPSESELWKAVKSGLVTERASPSVVSQRVAGFRQQARLLVEEDLLERWARHRNRGDSAQASVFLNSSRAIASELARLDNDLLLIDSVKALDRARPETLKDLATAHLYYAEATRLIKDYEFSAALDLLEKAWGLFHSGNSPFADWAAFQITVCLYQDSRYDRALEILEELEIRARAHSYRSLEARVLWLQGTILTFTARPAEALKRYELAHQIFSDLGERDNTAAVATLLAKSLEILGQDTSAWEHRFEALRIVSKSGDLVRTRVSFAEAASAFAALGEPKIGLFFQEESLRAARLLRKPSALTAALRQRASLRFAAGLFPQARSDLERAREEASQLGDPSLRETVENELALVESEILLEEEPERALLLMDQAIERTVQAEDRLYLPSLYIVRHRAHRLLGNLVRAEEDLRNALAEVENLRGGIADPKVKISYFDQKQSLIDEAVRFQLSERRNPRAALEFVERGRARMLAEWLSQVDVSTGSVFSYGSWSLKELQRNLHPGTIVLEYFLSEDMGYVWGITAENLILRPLPVTSKEAREMAIELEIRRTVENPQFFKEVLGQLFDSLIRPALEILPKGAQIVVVPDDDMNGIPFSALLDLKARRYLIEDFPLAIAPSLRGYLEAEIRTRIQAGTASIVVVGDPDIDVGQFSKLLPLAYARKEAENIYRLYGRGSLMMGKEATKEHFLEAARQSDIIHFAGHALPNRDNPFLSSLLFAPSSQSSGTLYVRELLERDFKRTRLVVLSACSTAVDEKGSSEEMLSLVTPFLAVGVPAVVGSLWDIDDGKVRPLMEEFHRLLSQGIPAGVALQEIKKRSLVERPSRSDPRFWGAFEVFGTGNFGNKNIK